MKEIKTKSTGRSRDRGKRKVRKNGVLRFQLALIIAMLMVYGGLEATFGYWQPVQVGPAPEPLTELVELPPKDWKPEQPKPQHERVQKNARRLGSKIKIEHNGKAEASKQTICTDCTPDPPKVDSIAYDPGPDEPLTLPLMKGGKIDEFPVFPGCEAVPNEERFECFNKRMQRHVRRVFRYPERDLAQGNEGKVYVQFRINEFGEIDQIQYRGQGTSESLDAEAFRIINKLPQMKPAKIAGKPVRVTYSIPIYFKLPQ